MDFSIGELARRTEVKVPTIRYYEQIGLLPPPPRTEGQQRRYDKNGMARLAFIKHARELGFDIEAIRALLSLQDNPDQSCSVADRIAKARLAEVEERIASLNALRTELQRMVEECASGRVAECRVIETLADSSHGHGRLVET
ncbi:MULTISPECIES: helix-turn-helix domain-containing protein [unclassified Mesorhizobium]|uniref:MerR family transcriptional regulator n=1 Tax=unclassified Mesorhizobium TaxID=325217 RepID=UPI000FD5DA9D|nr:MULTISPECIES: helix-turn-helix domain-containing protein [unclassified Mesorhizobium]RVB77441.1 MerR family transcriptional regulator [Mesorhizobium sp. M6A.T.Cr.TU.014.01.1.1]RWP71498.1 MAG: MerR family transcriptional regulator [Mesorhizobium sp.]RWQ01925.1 MAG: MerR family transcriptional regulator [Mesorhizobium sp.]RWQ03078.1 MAG: MerR family transcriptional regulator [Mesorhizobium sp.]